MLQVSPNRVFLNDWAHLFVAANKNNGKGYKKCKEKSKHKILVDDLRWLQRCPTLPMFTRFCPIIFKKWREELNEKAYADWIEEVYLEEGKPINELPLLVCNFVSLSVMHAMKMRRGHEWKLTFSWCCLPSTIIQRTEGHWVMVPIGTQSVYHDMERHRVSHKFVPFALLFTKTENGKAIAAALQGVQIAAKLVFDIDIELSSFVADCSKPFFNASKKVRSGICSMKELKYTKCIQIYVYDYILLHLYIIHYIYCYIQIKK